MTLLYQPTEIKQHLPQSTNDGTIPKELKLNGIKHSNIKTSSGGLPEQTAHPFKTALIPRYRLASTRLIS
jgi:hypothetical protein